MDHIDVVPGFKVARDFRVRRLISLTQSRKCLSGKHHSPAERIVGPVAFVNCNFVCALDLLHEDGKVHAGRPAADDVDFHARSSSNAAPNLSTPILKSSGSAHMPMRKCCGDSKKRPGTTAVSYFSCNRTQRSSTRPFISKG